MFANHFGDIRMVTDPHQLSHVGFHLNFFVSSQIIKCCTIFGLNAALKHCCDSLFHTNLYVFVCFQNYILRLESTLSKASYEYIQPEVLFTANVTYKHFTFQFQPKVRTLTFRRETQVIALNLHANFRYLYHVN